MLGLQRVHSSLEVLKPIEEKGYLRLRRNVYGCIAPSVTKVTFSRVRRLLSVVACGDHEDVW